MNFKFIFQLYYSFRVNSNQIRDLFYIQFTRIMLPNMYLK